MPLFLLAYFYWRRAVPCHSVLWLCHQKPAVLPLQLARGYLCRRRCVLEQGFGWSEAILPGVFQWRSAGGAELQGWLQLSLQAKACRTGPAALLCLCDLCERLPIGMVGGNLMGVCDVVGSAAFQAAACALGGWCSALSQGHEQGLQPLLSERMKRCSQSLNVTYFTLEMQEK